MSVSNAASMPIIAMARVASRCTCGSASSSSDSSSPQRVLPAELPQQQHRRAAHRGVGRLAQALDGLAARGAEADQDAIRCWRGRVRSSRDSTSASGGCDGAQGLAEPAGRLDDLASDVSRCEATWRIIAGVRML